MDQGVQDLPAAEEEEETSYSPVEGDAGSDDSLSHLERERALSEGEEEEEENRRRRREDIEEFAAGSAHFRPHFDCAEELTLPVPSKLIGISSRLCLLKSIFFFLFSCPAQQSEHRQSLPPNSTLSSASEDSNSLSLTDSDRTLLGDPPEMEEGFVGDPEMDESSAEAAPPLDREVSPFSAGRRNALLAQQGSQEEEDERAQHRRALLQPGVKGAGRPLVVASLAAASSIKADSKPASYIFKVLKTEDDRKLCRFEFFVHPWLFSY